MVWQRDCNSLQQILLWPHSAFLCSSCQAELGSCTVDVLILRTIWATFCASRRCAGCWVLRSQSLAMAFPWGANNQWEDCPHHHHHHQQLLHLHSVQPVLRWLKRTDGIERESKQLSVGVWISWPCPPIIHLWGGLSSTRVYQGSPAPGLPRRRWCWLCPVYRLGWRLEDISAN